MTHDQFQARTYGGWRRSRSIGLLGLGPTATLILLGCAVALLLVAAVSLKTLLFAAPPALLAGAASLVRVGGIPLAQLGVQRLRWWHGTTGGHTSYRAEVVLRHTGVLQLPGTLAATELLSAEDGCGGRYGLVRDRHTGFLTVTLRVVPASTWLAEPGEVDGWVANWGALAGLARLPARAAVGDRHGRHRPRPRLHPHRPGRRRDRPGRPAAGAAHHGPARGHRPGGGRRRGHPGQPHLRPRRLPLAGRAPSPRRSPKWGARCSGWNQRSARAASPCSAAPGRPTSPGSCGPRSTRRSGARSTGSSPPGSARRWRSSSTGPAPGPAGADEAWDCYRHGSGTSVTWAWREAPRQNVHSDVLARLVAPGLFPKRVTLQYRPFPAAAAARLLENEVRAAEFRSEYSRRTRRDVTARDAHDHARARQAADEEARGAGVSLLGLYVTVTVTDPAQLARAVADTEAAAESSKIRLQRMYRSQAAGFTATLPCGICLPSSPAASATDPPALTRRDAPMPLTRTRRRRRVPRPARSTPARPGTAVAAWPAPLAVRATPVRWHPRGAGRSPTPAAPPASRLGRSTRRPRPSCAACTRSSRAAAPPRPGPRSAGTSCGARWSAWTRWPGCGPGWSPTRACSSSASPAPANPPSSNAWSPAPSPFGTRVLVLGDTKPDYTRLVAHLGGQVIRIGRGLDKINPLDAGPLGTALARMTGPDAERLRQELRSRRLALLLALATLVREARISNAEEVILGRAIDLLDDRLAGTREPTVTDVLRVIEEGPDTLRSAARADAPHRYRRSGSPTWCSRSTCCAPGRWPGCSTAPPPSRSTWTPRPCRWTSRRSRRPGTSC